MPEEYHVVCASLIQRDNRYLLVQEGKEHVEGLWNLPAGGLEKGEKPADCAVREANEETGLNVVPNGLIGVYIGKIDQTHHRVFHYVYHTTILSGDVSVPDGDEIRDVDFFSYEKLQRKDLRAPYVKKAVEDFENWADHPTSVVKNTRR